MTEIEKLEQGIAALESQRDTLGDSVVDAMLAPIREKLAALRARSRSALTVDQRKQVTVLFADLSEFTALSDRLDAEDVVDKMNMLWSRLDQVIVRHGGGIDKHTGDGVMALFGAKATHEGDPEHAIRAALDMQKEILAFGVDHPDTQLQMRIGLNTGPVLLGEIGSRQEYTAMGDTVNLASRLEKAAPVGSVLISYSTYRHVRGLFDIQAQPPLVVKGKIEPVQTYVVLQAKPRAFRLQTRGIEGVETHMIGRLNELQQLQAAMRSVIDGRNLQAITVVGEAGVGKSRLLYEFNAWADLLPENWWIFKGRANEATHHLPYALLRDIFSFRFEIAESDSLAVAREKLEQGIVGFMPGDSEAAMKAHFIGHLIGFDFSASPFLRGVLHDAKQIRDRAYHYLIQFITSVTQNENISASVILLEDIHWADNSSLDALKHILQNAMDLPLLTLSFTRPTFFELTDWVSVAAPRHIRIDLHPLSLTESHQLVDEILQKATDIPLLLRDLVVNRAEGNPLYVEELIKVLIDEQAIIPGEEQWQVVPERLSKVRIPPTLTGILQTRLDGLSVSELEALQCAAVVGRVFWGSAVAYLEQVSPKSDVYNSSDQLLDETFQTLLRRELIFNREFSSFSGTREYIFKHTLLRDVTYETVLKRLRHTYHELAAIWLVEQSGERVNEYAGLIAEHYERAGELPQASEWYERAGEQAAATFAPDTALGYLEKALALSEDVTSRIGIQIKLAGVLELLGRWDEAATHCQSALTLVKQDVENTDHTLAARCQQLLGQLSVLRGDYGSALEWLENAQAEWMSIGDHAGLGQTLTTIGNVHWRKGEYVIARQYLEESLTMARGSNDRRVMALALNNLGNVASDQGDNALARSLYEESLAIRREMGDKRGIVGSLNNLGNVASDLGDNDAARILYEECLSQLREVGDRRGMGLVLSNLGVIVLEQGDLATALNLHEESLALKRSMGDKPGIAMSLNNLGIVAIEQKDYDMAQKYFAEALSLAHEIGDQHTLIYDLVGLAGVAMQIGSDRADRQDAQRSARLLSAAATLLAFLGASMEPIIRRMFDRTIELARAFLGEESFDMAWGEGGGMPLEQVLVFALEK